MWQGLCWVLRHSRNKAHLGLPPGLRSPEKSGWKDRVLAQSWEEPRKLWELRGGPGPSLGDWEGFLKQETLILVLQWGWGVSLAQGGAGKRSVPGGKNNSCRPSAGLSLDTSPELAKLEYKLKWRENSDGVERLADGDQIAQGLGGLSLRTVGAIEGH